MRHQAVPIPGENAFGKMLAGGAEKRLEKMYDLV